jgi:hypothetical protein
MAIFEPSDIRTVANDKRSPEPAARVALRFSCYGVLSSHARTSAQYTTKRADDLSVRTTEVSERCGVGPRWGSPSFEPAHQALSTPDAFATWVAIASISAGERQSYGSSRSSFSRERIAGIWVYFATYSLVAGEVKRFGKAKADSCVSGLIQDQPRLARSAMRRAVLTLLDSPDLSDVLEPSQQSATKSPKHRQHRHDRQ